MLRITSIPSSGMDAARMMNALGRRRFALIFDVGREITYFYVDDEEKALGLVRNAMPGFEAGASEPVHAKSIEVVSVYKAPEENCNILSNMAARLDAGIFGAFFAPCSEKDVSRSKAAVEAMLSSKAVKSTKSSYGGFFGRKSDVSMHMDLFNGSEERKMLMSILEDADSTLLAGRPLFSVAIVLFDDSGAAREALGEVSVVMGSVHGVFENIGQIFPLVSSKSPLAFGASHTAGFMGVMGVERLGYAIETFFGNVSCIDPIMLGTYSRDGVLDTGRGISIPKSSLNLGAIISGLPGAGKTREAMAIIDNVERSTPRPGIIVISPTSEWGNFAAGHNMHLDRVGVDDSPLNLLTNPEGTEVGKFYEDLAMLLSSASNSGPYINPMEKCLLNAFRLCVHNGITGPTHIYDQIEESIIRFHGKRTNAGVRYTKHGENIKAALEDLRQILSDWRYSGPSGVSFRELAMDGAVFDLSGISNNAKPYFYALLLTQLYAIADTLDDEGDGGLRMLICIEEAQTIFGADRRSAASLDLISRIQDFRKKGIGIMLLVHSITDIAPEIRRMCQNKLYLKQAPDVAAIAAKDLIFTYAEQEDVVSKLKHLDSRMAAANFVSKFGVEKLSHDSVFLRTRDYEVKTARANPLPVKDKKAKSTIISLLIDDTRKERTKKVAAVSVSFIGEVVCTAEVRGGRCGLEALPDRLYSVALLSESGKGIASCKITAKALVRLRLDDTGLSARQA